MLYSKQKQSRIFILVLKEIFIHDGYCDRPLLPLLQSLQSMDCRVSSSTLLMRDQCTRYPNGEVTKNQDGTDHLFIF